MAVSSIPFLPRKGAVGKMKRWLTRATGMTDMPGKNGQGGPAVKA